MVHTNEQPRNAIRDPSLLWPNGVVYYTVGLGFSKSHLFHFHHASFLHIILIYFKAINFICLHFILCVYWKQVPKNVQLLTKPSHSTRQTLASLSSSERTKEITCPFKRLAAGKSFTILHLHLPVYECFVNAAF
jgi:hypothetical protein